MPAPQVIPFGEWQPDKSDRQNPACEAKGVYSYGGQYAPFPDLQDYGAANIIDSRFRFLLHMDGPDASTDFIDDSPNPKTWTAQGNAQIDTAESVFGGASGLFDGAGDFVSTPDHADFTVGTSDFIFACRFNCNVAGGTDETIAGQCDAGGTAASTSIRVFRNASNTITARIAVGAAATDLVGTTQFTNAVNTGWHSIIFARIAGALSLYIDETLEGSGTNAGSVNNSAQNWTVGSADAGGGNPWTGWLDEVALIVDDDLTDLLASLLASPDVPFSFGAGAEDVVLGARAVYDSSTNPHIFFGDDDRLYKLESRIAVDVSKAGGYSVASTATWQFAQFGDNVVAVTSGLAPQHYTLGTSVDFANLAGSPPSGATAVARINDFLMLGEGFTVHWSAFNDITDWTPDPGTQAGNQELDQEQGVIQQIVGLDYAAIFQERAVRRAIYVGPPVIWDFGQDYVEKARGCISRNAAATYGRIIFYAADDGFYAFDGQTSTGIGAGKVDDYFSRRLNYAYRHKVAVGVDGLRKLVVFGFPAGSSQFISELLIYSLIDGRWTHDEIDLEFLYDTPAEPLTVETVSAVWGDDIDASEIADIDSDVFNDRRRRLAGFTTSDHRLVLFTGLTRPATIDTGEFEALPGRRSLVTEIWPAGDMEAAAVSASIGYRLALPGAGVTFTNATVMNRVGFCPQRLDARFMRGRLQIGAGSSWRRMEGIYATAYPTGGR